MTAEAAQPFKDMADNDREQATWLKLFIKLDEAKIENGEETPQLRAQVDDMKVQLNAAKALAEGWDIIAGLVEAQA